MSRVSGGSNYDVLGGSPLVEGGNDFSGGGPLHEYRRLRASTNSPALNRAAHALVALVVLLIAILAVAWLSVDQDTKSERNLSRAIAWLILIVAIGSTVFDVLLPI